MSMSNERYLAIQMQLTTLAGLVADMPLGEFLERIARAEAMGPMVDPTLYRKAHRKLEAIRDLAEGLQEFKRTAMKLREDVLAELAEGGGDVTQDEPA